MSSTPQFREKGRSINFILHFCVVGSMASFARASLISLFALYKCYVRTVDNSLKLPSNRSQLLNPQQVQALRLVQSPLIITPLSISLMVLWISDGSSSHSVGLEMVQNLRPITILPSLRMNCLVFSNTQSRFKLAQAAMCQE